MLMAPAVAAARPVQELFLGETSDINQVGEVQVSAGLAGLGRELAFPLAAEVGLSDHVEITSELGESAAVHLGARTSGLSTYIGAEWSATDDRMAPPSWAAIAALGISHGRFGLHLSGGVDSQGLEGVAGISFAVGRIVPIAELSRDHEGTTLAAGAVWQFHDDLELGFAASIDHARMPSLLLRLVAELDVLRGGER
jgi:hypothetical protein